MAVRGCKENSEVESKPLLGSEQKEDVVCVTISRDRVAPRANQQLDVAITRDRHRPSQLRRSESIGSIFQAECKRSSTNQKIASQAIGGTAAIIGGTDEDSETVQELKSSIPKRDVPFERIGTTIIIPKNNPSPVSSISSVRSSRASTESGADIDPNDSPQAQFNSCLRRSRMQRLQTRGAGQGAMVPKSIVELVKARHEREESCKTSSSSSSTEDQNAKPKAATSAWRLPFAEITEPADCDLDDKRVTESGVNATSKSWGKVFIPLASAADEGVQGFPAFYDEARPASSGAVSPAVSRAVGGDDDNLPIIVDADKEKGGSKSGGGHRDRRSDLTASGKHDKVSRQSSSGVTLSCSTTSARESNSSGEGCRSAQRGTLERPRSRRRDGSENSAAISARKSGQEGGDGGTAKTPNEYGDSSIVKLQRLVRASLVRKRKQSGAANRAKLWNRPMLTNVQPQPSQQTPAEEPRGRTSANTGVSGRNREKLGGGDQAGVVVLKINDGDKRQGSSRLEMGCEAPKQSQHIPVRFRSPAQTRNRQDTGVARKGAAKGGENHDGLSASRPPIDGKEEEREAGMQLAGERADGTGTGTANPSDNDEEREETERRLVDEPEHFPRPHTPERFPGRDRAFEEAMVGSIEGAPSCDRVTPIAVMTGKVEVNPDSSNRQSASVLGNRPTEVVEGNRRHDSAAKASTASEEPLTGEGFKPSPTSRAGGSIGPAVAVWKWGEGISGLDYVRLEGITDTSDGVDEWHSARRYDEAAPRPPGASILPLQQSSSTLGKYAYPPRPEETPAVMEPVLSLACGHLHAALLLSGGGLATLGWGGRGQVGHGHCGGEIHEADPVVVHFGDRGHEEALHSRTGRRRVSGSFEKALPGENLHERETSLLQSVGSEKYSNRVKENHEWDKCSSCPPRGARLMTVDVRGVACGRYHTVAFDWSGAVWTWGAGAEGALGHGDRQSSNVPRRVLPLTNVVVEGVACGAMHTLALGLQRFTSVGNGSRQCLSPAGAPVVVYRWGFIHFNRSVLVPGRRRSQGSSLPIDAAQLSGKQPEGRTLLRPAMAESLAGLKIVQISCGARHSGAIDGSGLCYTSGCNLSGQLGRRPTNSAPDRHRSQDHVNLATSRGFKGDSEHCREEREGPREGDRGSGSFDRCSILRGARSFSVPNSGNEGMVDVPHMPGGIDGDLEHEGEGGDGFGKVDLRERRDGRGFAGCTSVACGGSHTLVLTPRREVWSWGDNLRGQLGHGDFLERSNPTLVSKIEDVRSIAAGDETSAATTFAGVVFLWGCNSEGRLGLNLGDADVPSPMVAPVLSGLGVLQVGLGGTYGLCLSARKPENMVRLPMVVDASKAEQDPDSTATLSWCPESSLAETWLPDALLRSTPPALQAIGCSPPATRNPRSPDAGEGKGAYSGRYGREREGIAAGFNPRSAASDSPEDAVSRSGDGMFEGGKDGGAWSKTVIADGKTPGLASVVTKRSPRRSEPTVRAQCRARERGRRRCCFFPHVNGSPSPERHQHGIKSGYIPGGYKGRLTAPDFGERNRVNRAVAANPRSALMTIAPAPGSSLPMVTVSIDVSERREEYSLGQAHVDAELVNEVTVAPGASGEALRPVLPSSKSRSIKGRGRFTRRSHQASVELAKARAPADDRRLEKDPDGRLPDDYIFVFDDPVEPRWVGDATSNAGPDHDPRNSTEEAAMGDAAIPRDILTGNAHQQPPISLKPSVRESLDARNGREMSKARDGVTGAGTGGSASARTAGSEFRRRDNNDLPTLDNLHAVAQPTAEALDTSAGVGEGKAMGASKPPTDEDRKGSKTAGDVEFHSHLWAQDSALTVFSGDYGNSDHAALIPPSATTKAGSTGAEFERFPREKAETTGAGAISPPPVAKAAFPPLPGPSNEGDSVDSGEDSNTTVFIPGRARPAASMSTDESIEDGETPPRRNEKIDAPGAGQPRGREEIVRAVSSSGRSGVAGVCGSEIRASSVASAAPAQDLSPAKVGCFSRIWDGSFREMNPTANQARENRPAAMHREDAAKEYLDGAKGSVPDVPAQNLSTVEGSFFSHLWVKSPSGKGDPIADTIGESSLVKLKRESDTEIKFDGAADAAAEAAAASSTSKQLPLDARVSQTSRRDTTFCQSSETFASRRSSAGRISVGMLGNPVVDERNSALVTESRISTISFTSRGTILQIPSERRSSVSQLTGDRSTSHGPEGLCTIGVVESSSEETNSEEEEEGLSSDESDRSDAEKSSGGS